MSQVRNIKQGRQHSNTHQGEILSVQKAWLKVLGVFCIKVYLHCLEVIHCSPSPSKEFNPVCVNLHQNSHPYRFCRKPKHFHFFVSTRKVTATSFGCCSYLLTCTCITLQQEVTKRNMLVFIIFFKCSMKTGVFTAHKVNHMGFQSNNDSIIQ